MSAADLRYTREHEWVAVSGDRGRVGITDYAQKQLGDVVFVQLPDVGATFKQGQIFGSVESVKAVSDLYSPMSGKIVEVNAKLGDHPEIINSDPLGSWMIVLELGNPAEAASLLTAEQYNDLVK